MMAKCKGHRVGEERLPPYLQTPRVCEPLAPFLNPPPIGSNQDSVGTADGGLAGKYPHAP